MRLLVPLIAFVRGQMLDRQFRRIERSADSLPHASRARLSLLALREIGQAAACEFPHLYGTPPQERYLPWGQGTSLGYARACSDNPEIAMRGIAQWLAVAYHETKHSHYAFMQARHRRLLRLVRELKDLHGTGGKDARSEDADTEAWMNRAPA